MSLSDCELRENLKRQARIYIDAIIAGEEGELVRFHAHEEFVRRLPDGANEDDLSEILHNLDKVIGFHYELMKKLDEDARQFYTKELFKKLCPLYRIGGSCCESKRLQNDANSDG